MGRGTFVWTSLSSLRMQVSIQIESERQRAKEVQRNNAMADWLQFQKRFTPVPDVSAYSI